MCFKEIKRHGGKITLNMFVKFIPARCSCVRQTSLKEISFAAQVVTLIITNIKHLSQIISYQTFQNFEHCGMVFFCVVCSQSIVISTFVQTFSRPAKRGHVNYLQAHYFAHRIGACLVQCNANNRYCVLFECMASTEATSRADLVLDFTSVMLVVKRGKAQKNISYIRDGPLHFSHEVRQIQRKIIRVQQKYGGWYRVQQT